MPLAIIGLVCPEARVKFKNIDFQTEADFACYCNTIKVKIIDILILFANLQALKSEVPVVCLATGCVSGRRDRR